jgi:hypothetical protein
MGRCRCGMVIAGMFGILAMSAGMARGEMVASEVYTADLLKGADVVCKVKVESLKVTKEAAAMQPMGGTEYEATCRVITQIKGETGVEVKVPVRTRPSEINRLEKGKVYILFLYNREASPLGGTITGEEAAVENNFGKEPGDRLLAELVAKAKDKDAEMRAAGITELGMLRDARGVEVIKPAQNDADASVVRAAVIALYRLKVAPDVEKVMAVFNPKVVDVWYQESGTPQKDANGKSIWRRENGVPFLERGLPDFDYVTYVREGIKHDWVRKDYFTLAQFFGVPWVLQRRECVPVLVKLLDDGDQNVRRYAVACLNRTVNDNEGPQLEEFKKAEEKYLAEWKTWWKEKGAAYMAEKPARE